MSEAGYRSAGQKRRPYDPDIRVRPCESCGEPMVVGVPATLTHCASCGREQAVPEVQIASLKRAAETSDSARREILSKQRYAPWDLPADTGVVEFAEVLIGEIARAHRTWVERLARVQRDHPDVVLCSDICTAASAECVSCYVASNCGEGCDDAC